MWDILLHNSQHTSSVQLGDGLFDLSFFQAMHDTSEEKETVETEIFHHSTRAVDTSDGGQALPPYSNAANGRKNAWDRPHSAPVDGSVEQYPPLPETMMWSGPGFRGDGPFMDLTRDPFFQFQDHQGLYTGMWEIRNL